MSQRCNHIRKKQEPSFNGRDHSKLLLSKMRNLTEVCQDIEKKAMVCCIVKWLDLFAKERLS